ncbi:hypothetical protein BU17DRAFT_66815 [Hysterangium stoloniferum]|nr:hypothetical protein BU17DRAFT_66815 [Hysterangium stoloniferum]
MCSCHTVTRLHPAKFLVYTHMSQKKIPIDLTGPATVKKSSLKRQRDSVDPSNIIEGFLLSPVQENQDENSDCDSKDDAGQVKTNNHDVNSVANMSDGNDLSDAFDYVPHKQKTTGKHKVAKKVQDAQKAAAPVLSVLNVRFRIPYMDGSTKVVGIVEAKANEPYDTVIETIFSTGMLIHCHPKKRPVLFVRFTMDKQTVYNFQNQKLRRKVTVPL